MQIKCSEGPNEKVQWKSKLLLGGKKKKKRSFFTISSEACFEEERTE